MDTKAAIQEHYLWRMTLRTAITTTKKLDVGALSAKNACQTESWLQKEGKEMYGTNQMYPLVVEAHQRFHSEVIKIARTINEGKYEEATAMLEPNKPLEDATRELTSRLTRLMSH
jgi:hypothetical protein